MDWKPLGELHDYSTTLSLPIDMKELQVVVGVGKYRMIYNVSHAAINAVIAGDKFTVCSARVFADGNWNEISAIIKFNAQSAWVNLVTLDEAVTSSFIVWFYYR